MNLLEVARRNDLPNWLALAFTVVLWPSALLAWNRRWVNGVPGLEVRFAKGSIRIGSNPHEAIDIQFTNHTGSVVYISNGRIRNCTAAFVVPLDADRDIAQNSHHLAFIDETGNFRMREVTLQTNAAAKTCIAAPSGMPESFYRYAPPWYARVVRRQKYFVLEYVAMVGTSRHSVATLY
jgi:hypothetical protein